MHTSGMGRARGRVVLSLLAIAATIGTVVTASVLSPAPTVPHGPHVTEAQDAATAVTAAHRQGTPVEILDERTPTRQVFANPQGTRTAELSVVPKRVRKGTAWVGIDTTLVRRADGTVAPRAADGDLVLSGGGEQPLLTVQANGHPFALDWPGPLPTPRLARNTATYPEVLPGVDLVLHAERSGYRQHFVVKRPGAAPPEFRLGMRTDLTVTAKDGMLRATDQTGAEVFSTPPATMWDAKQRRTKVGVQVGIQVGADVLTLTPDHAFLADPATTYPVTVDPDATYQRNAWATVLSGRDVADDSYWWTSGDGRNAQVGQCYPSPNCNGIGEAWGYFRFWSPDFAGANIISSTLATTVVHSPDCGGTHTHQVWRTDTTFEPNLTWLNKPQGYHMNNFESPKVCDGNRSVGIPVTFNPTGMSTYYLRAANGTDGFAWRKYLPEETVLRIEYNRPPNLPYGLRTDPPVKPPCKWCAGRSYVADQSIRLITSLSDPDNDAVLPQWRYTYTGQTTALNGAAQASGATHDTTVPLGRDGDFVWWVHASDGRISSAQVNGPASFVVDTKAPANKPLVSSVVYPDDVNGAFGGVGVPGDFTFTANGVTDVDHYLYGWQDVPTTKIDADALGGKATVTLAPEGDGRRTLYVRSVDRAGHQSETTKHAFFVRAGNGPRAQWSFEGNANDTAHQGDRHGTVHGDVTYAPGAVGTAARFGGAPGTEVTAPTAVRTDASFSVSAWVKLNQTDSGWYSAVTQMGNTATAFNLYYQGDLKRWVFVLPGSDTANPEFYFVRPPNPPVATWTHLAGTYDSATRLISLYVNGELAGTATRGGTPWRGTGDVRIGKDWPGMIDEVTMYDRVVSAGEVKAMVSRDNVQVGYWRLDDEPGSTTARDSVEGGDAGVLKNGATFTEDGLADGAVQLDGHDDHIATSRPSVRTDQSFTAAAWVWADELVTDDAAMTALSQDGDRNSGFALQYNSTLGRWVFVKFSTDDDATGWVGLSAPDIKPELDKWVHLAGVYDGPTKQLRFYVNGLLVATGTQTGTPWDATGPLAIGRGKFGGAAVSHWPGKVDEVRMYSRALSAAELEGIVTKTDAPTAHYKLDAAVADETGAHNGTAVGSPSWTAGQSSDPDPTDLAVSLDGVDDHVRVAPVVNTTQSYSVSAWVRLGAKDSNWRSVVSQAGTKTAAFTLGYDGGADRWAFQVNNEAQTANTRVVASGAAQVGVWTHLAAVYQAGTGDMRLYVNGTAAGTGRFTTPFDARAEFDIGRTKWNGAYANNFFGAIDDMKVYARPLFASEVLAAAGRDLTLVHNWRLDEGTGSSAMDAVGGRSATLSGGAGYEAGRVNNALTFNGTGAAATTTGVDLATDRSFTVSTWVKLRQACGEVCKSTAVSVDGGANLPNKFRLGHTIDNDQAPGPYGKWVFEMPEQSGRVTEAAISVRPGEFGTWVFLVGVYDAPAGKLWLYVHNLSDDSADFDDGTLLTPWASTGGVTIGRGKQGVGGPGQYWPGSVDDVRLYTTDLTADRIGTLYRSYAASAPSATLPAPDGGHWQLNDTTGTTASDSSGRGVPATLRGATWAPGGRDGTSLALNGTSGFAETAGQVLDTTAGFSVSAWANLTPTTSGNRTVVSQDGASASAFRVGYEPSTARWVATVQTTDPAGGPVRLTSTEPALPGHWTHLMLTYDDKGKQLRLYVNGLVSSVRVGVSPIASTGPFAIGRARANTEFFPGYVDDVRAFTRALSEGEVRRVRDDVNVLKHGRWAFEGTAADTSFRRNPTTLSGGTSFVPGIRGQALALDGTSGFAMTQQGGANMLDSFTVSGWAKLSRTDKDATIVAQDGNRMSGFVLQYNNQYKRWAFGAPAQDGDFAAMLYALSPAPPVVNRWTHVAGVYDLPARQLRLYVDGELAGMKDNVAAWWAGGQMTIGRSKSNGAPAAFFPGTLDEVDTDLGAATPAQLAQRTASPAPAGGQLNRVVSDTGERATISSPGTHADAAVVPAGYRMQAPLGQLLPAEAAGTRQLFSCRSGTDTFTATTCGTATTVAPLGWAYTAEQADVPTVALSRCVAGTDRFDSVAPDCEGGTRQEVLGYVVAYAGLVRSVSVYQDWDRTATVYGTAPGFARERSLGMLRMTAGTGTTQLFACRDGVDDFVSPSANCDGKTVVTSIGWLWTEPPAGTSSQPLFRCHAGTERFVSDRENCEGATVDGRLGYVLTANPPAGMGA